MTSILTGDIINSKKNDTQLWANALKAILNSYGNTPLNWQIYRGDSFQLEVKKPTLALLTALHIKAYLKEKANVNVRIAIGIGNKEFISNKLSESNGQAFINSGFAFDNYLKKQTLAIKTPWQTVNEEFNLAIELALVTVDFWSKNSAEVFNMYLKHSNATQKEIGNLLGITQGRVSERQKRAGLDPILNLNTRFKSVINAKLTS